MGKQRRYQERGGFSPGRYSLKAAASHLCLHFDVVSLATEYIFPLTFVEFRWSCSYEMILLPWRQHIMTQGNSASKCWKIFQGPRSCFVGGFHG